LTINTYRESSLHLALKQHFAHPDGEIEQPIDGYIVDVVKDDMLLEIQTRNFTSIRPKLEALLQSHPVRLIHPIPLKRQITKLDMSGSVLSRRKSPLKGHISHLFLELIRCPQLFTYDGFSLAVAMIHEEEIRCDDGKGSWRRKGWSIQDRRLLEVNDVKVLNHKEELLLLLPEGLADPFDTGELARGLKQRRAIAQKMAYCLRKLDLLEVTGKRGNAYLYSVCR